MHMWVEVSNMHVYPLLGETTILANLNLDLAHVGFRDSIVSCTFHLRTCKEMVLLLIMLGKLRCQLDVKGCFLA